MQSVDDKGIAERIMAYTAAFSTDKKHCSKKDEKDKWSHTCFKTGFQVIFTVSYSSI